MHPYLPRYSETALYTFYYDHFMNKIHVEGVKTTPYILIATHAYKDHCKKKWLLCTKNSQLLQNYISHLLSMIFDDFSGRQNVIFQTDIKCNYAFSRQDLISTTFPGLNDGMSSASGLWWKLTVL